MDRGRVHERWTSPKWPSHLRIATSVLQVASGPRPRAVFYKSCYFLLFYFFWQLLLLLTFQDFFFFELASGAKITLGSNVLIRGGKGRTWLLGLPGGACSPPLRRLFLRLGFSAPSQARSFFLHRNSSFQPSS